MKTQRLSLFGSIALTVTALSFFACGGTEGWNGTYAGAGSGTGSGSAAPSGSSAVPGKITSGWTGEPGNFQADGEVNGIATIFTASEPNLANGFFSARMGVPTVDLFPGLFPFRPFPASPIRSCNIYNSIHPGDDHSYPQTCQIFREPGGTIRIGCSCMPDPALYNLPGGIPSTCIQGKAGARFECRDKCYAQNQNLTCDQAYKIVSRFSGVDSGMGPADLGCDGPHVSPLDVDYVLSRVSFACRQIILEDFPVAGCNYQGSSSLPLCNYDQQIVCNTAASTVPPYSDGRFECRNIPWKKPARLQPNPNTICSDIMADQGPCCTAEELAKPCPGSMVGVCNLTTGLRVCRQGYNWDDVCNSGPAPMCGGGSVAVCARSRAQWVCVN